MTACPSEFVAFVLDQLGGLSGLEDRRMFGAWGLARAGINFASLTTDNLFFVVDAHSREKYLAAGMAPFGYTKKTGRVWLRRYYQVPVEILEDRERLLAWAEESAEIAQRTPKR